jgi:hypothetical protein
MMTLPPGNVLRFHTCSVPICGQVVIAKPPLSAPAGERSCVRRSRTSQIFIGRGFPVCYTRSGLIPDDRQQPGTVHWLKVVPQLF